MKNTAVVYRALLLAVLLATLASCASPAPAETPTSMPTYTPLPTYTPAPTYTVEPTAVPTYTPFPTYTPLPTYTPEPTKAPEPTDTPGPTETPAPTTRPAPPPTAVPPTSPPDPCAGIPADVSGRITPKCGKAGMSVQISIWGFTPNEQIGFWLTDPNGNAVGTVQTYNIGPSGSVDFPPIATDPDMIQGIWFWVFEGTTSHHQTILYFKIIP